MFELLTYFLMLCFKAIKIVLSIAYEIVEIIPSLMISFNPRQKRKIEIDNLSIYKIDNMTGYEFENFLLWLFEKLGYKILKPPQKTGDFGADLVIQNKK